VTSTDTPTPRAATGRLVVSSGDEIVTAWGNTTFDQTMEVFASAADRDTQWPTPHDGAVAYTLDTQTPWLRRSGAWTVFYGPPPPVTAGTGVQSYIDQSGEVWVAMVGVNGGAWKRARDVLHAQWTRTAAAWNAGTAMAAFAYNQVVNDPYGMYTAAGGFVAPIAGLWRLVAAAGATATATGQWFQIGIRNAAATNLSFVMLQTSLAQVVAPVADYQAVIPAGTNWIPQQQASATLTGLTDTFHNRLYADYLGTG
jgi:hypothetical protein